MPTIAVPGQAVSVFRQPFAIQPFTIQPFAIQPFTIQPFTIQSSEGTKSSKNSQSPVE